MNNFDLNNDNSYTIKVGKATLSIQIMLKK